ncbi:MAG: hypothetical protein K1000chlam4_00405 [Chlamydiae bacterium]|nr:hypothetical protein [Chlamydiota bacterium]
MNRFKGTIALDIDGTITVNKHELEIPVKKYLSELVERGWRLIFLTGRSFSFATPLFQDFEGEYLIGVQNGSALYSMPTATELAKHYLPCHFLPAIETVFHEEQCGFVVESGRENQDICYYKTANFTPEGREYLKFRISISPEMWVDTPSYESLPLKNFAVGKYFATKEQAHRIADKIRKIDQFNVMVITDPYREGYHVAHISQKGASKARALSHFMEKDGPLIVAGDDYNDEEMVKMGDVKIVMENAPRELHSLADILAPPAKEQGIIPALEEAIGKI